MMIGLAGSVLLSTVLFMITAIGFRNTILNKVLGGFFERVETGASQISLLQYRQISARSLQYLF